MFEFIESPEFDNARDNYLDDDEYAELQVFMLQNPEYGDIVPGSGGVRKLRWHSDGSGKRGGLRIIYYVRYRPGEFWMITLYAKTRRQTIPGEILRRLKEVFENAQKKND